MRPHTRPYILMCAIMLLVVLAPRLPALASPTKHADGAESSLATLSAFLLENVGQFDARARFRIQAAGATLWLAQEAIWMTALADDTDTDAAGRPSPPRGGVHLRLTFPGANLTPRLEPFGPLDTRVASFRGKDPSGWQTDIPAWSGVRYVELYPGVDLEIVPEGLSWAWRMVARDADGQALLAGTRDGSPLRLRVDGAEGGTVDAGTMVLHTPLGGLALPLLGTDAQGTGATPVLTHTDGALEVAHPFSADTLEGDGAGSALSAGSADLLYSTFLGGSGVDTGRDVAVDAAGNVYVTGETWSTDFPVTPGAFDTAPSAPEMDSDAFLAKLAPDGRSLLYATFIGGAGHDNSYAVAVDADGNAYITGETQSADFAATPGAFDGTYSTVGWSDAFVVKLNASGSALGYATYLGGSDTDIGYGIAVDASGHAYVAGYTGYTDPGMADYEAFPTTPGAFDETHNGAIGDTDAFVVKLNASGSGLVYGTFYGAGHRDEAYDLAIDAAGCAYVTGMSQSTDLPVTLGAFATAHSGDDDAFVVKLSADGTSLAYAGFLGGDDSDWGYAIAVDNVGSAYVTGFTASPTFPTTPGAFDVTHNGEYDAFVTKVSADGGVLSYSTFLGGSLADKGRAIAVDRYWCAYVAGETYSTDNAMAPGAFDTEANGQKDAFAAKLNTTGGGLAYGTYLGGIDEDVAHSIAVGEPGGAVITGETGSFNYPTTAGAMDIGFNYGGRDAMVSHLAMPGGEQPTATPTLTPSLTPNAGPSPTATAVGETTPDTGDSGSPTATPTLAPPSPTPTAEAGGYPEPGPTATATPRPSATPDPRLWARCYAPVLIRP